MLRALQLISGGGGKPRKFASSAEVRPVISLLREPPYRDLGRSGGHDGMRAVYYPVLYLANPKNGDYGRSTAFGQHRLSSASAFN